MDRVDHEPAASPMLRRAGARRGRVMIVGAEPSVRSVTRRMLALRGFDAVEVSSLHDVHLVLGAQSEAITGVVLDLGMPARIAEKIFGSLRLARPGLPILFTGGYGEEVLAERLAGADETDFLPKPFGLDALGSKADHLFAG